MRNHNIMQVLAFDVGQRFTNAQRDRLRTSAQNSGLWSYVEPENLSPTWVHFDRRQLPPACTTGGYPLIRRGSLSVYVLIAQDDLNTLGYRTGGLDGIFGSVTYNAVRLYQASRGLNVDGVIGCNTWRSLTRKCDRNRKNIYNFRLINKMAYLTILEICRLLTFILTMTIIGLN